MWQEQPARARGTGLTVHRVGKATVHVDSHENCMGPTARSSVCSQGRPKGPVKGGEPRRTGQPPWHLSSVSSGRVAILAESTGWPSKSS